jgi:hypothetical protein
MIMPAIWLRGILLPKNINPKIIANMGVSELSVPASALSILVSAIQNKNAGKKLPNTPENIIHPESLKGILLLCLINIGVSTIPAVIIRIAATCEAVSKGFLASSYKPSFIKINELPHIRQIEININQLTS